jgi:hypothetical protein
MLLSENLKELKTHIYTSVSDASNRTLHYILAFDKPDLMHYLFFAASKTLD